MALVREEGRVRRDGQQWAATAGGSALVATLWAPWFNRRLSSVIAPGPGVGTVSVSGWRALGGGLGAFVLVAGLAGVGWALWQRRRRVSGAWVVLLGALALLAEITVTVARVGVDNLVTTTPAAGLALAFAGAAAVVLAGLVALVRESAPRA